MDGTLGSQTAWMLDGSGVRDHEPARSCRDRPRGAAAGLPGRRPRNRRPGQPRGARRIRGDARRLAAARAAPADRARAAALRPRTSAASRELGVAASVQFSPRAVRPRPRRPLLGRQDSTAPTPSARCSTRAPCVANGSDAPIEELDPLAGIRAGVLRTIDDRDAWHPEQALTVEQALRRDHRRAGVARRRRAPPRQARSPATSPTWSCSTATRPCDGRAPEVQVVATMVGGAWVHNPPPW